MARIRSVHPGLWTDESFVSVSPLARLLFIGLWNECDDHGAFEWKPVTLKMRLFPVDNADIPTLLAELARVNMVRSYEHDGREYGAVRNFTKFQRPKKPKAVHFMPPEFRTFVGLRSDSSEPESDEPEPVTTKSELFPQMEEEGGRREKERKQDTGPKRAGAGRYAFEAGIIRLSKKDFDAWKAAFSHLNVPAELTALADWAGRPEQAGKWFHAVASALAKRDREALRAMEVAKNAPNGGPLPSDHPDKWKEAIL